MRGALACSVWMAGTHGALLRAPTPMSSEKHVEIMGHVKSVLVDRRAALTGLGCPAALMTDDILRDEEGLRQLLCSVFPEAIANPLTACVIAQDPIHRR